MIIINLSENFKLKCPSLQSLSTLNLYNNFTRFDDFETRFNFKPVSHTVKNACMIHEMPQIIFYKQVREQETASNNIGV